MLKDGAYVWEEFGTIQTEVDLSGYVTNETFDQLVQRVQHIEVAGVFADNIYTSTGQQVVVQYNIPANLYDSAVNEIQTDDIVEPEP